MTRSASLSILLVLLVACSSDESQGESLSGVNPCATEGALYLQHCLERAGGTCGSIPDALIDTNNQDDVSGGLRCEKVTEDACTVRASGCHKSVDACTLWETFETSFAEDGSNATVIMAVDVECSDGSTCSSMYDCTLKRQ